MALGKNWNAKQLTTALSNLNREVNKKPVDFDKMIRKSKARRTRMNKKATATQHQVMGVNDDNWFGRFTSGDEDIDDCINLFVKDLTTHLKGKGRLWAQETRAMMREVSPVLTGNLRDSIKILSATNVNSNSVMEQLEVVDKGGEVIYLVGVDEKAILPPPRRKHIIRGPGKGRMKVMPDYDYTRDADRAILARGHEDYLGYDFLEKWREIAKRNMERIFR